MFRLLSETTGDAYDTFSDLLADEGDFSLPSGNSEKSNSPPAPNEPEDRPEQPITNDDVDGWRDYDPDIHLSQFDGQCDSGSSNATQIRINGAHDRDIIPHMPVNRQGTKPVSCAIFFLTHISTDCQEGTHQFSVSRQWW
jgi:hypothetical protein